jgi:endonuclease YncB( thermonuclease family)
MAARRAQTTGAGARLPLEIFLRRRGRRRLGAFVFGLVLAAALAAADRRGWFVQDGDWSKYHGRSFTVARVVDGDTLDVDVPDGKHAHTRIRLWGIDTPEMNVGKPELGPQPWAVEATDRARALADGKRVTLELQSHEIRDRYGRLLAYVRLPDGTYLNEQLVLAGLARADRRFPHERMDRYLLLEEQARRDGIGLWRKEK